MMLCRLCLKQITPLRVIASSETGQWLKVDAFEEMTNPLTGRTEGMCILGDEGDSEVQILPHVPFRLAIMYRMWMDTHCRIANFLPLQPQG